ncbi:MAG: NAD(P)-dependent oxidoreductase [Hyphomicrobiaceae bacterium]
MRHILIGGSGFVGRVLAHDLARMGEEVVVADIEKADSFDEAAITFRHLDVTDREAVRRLDIRADDMVYNLSAKMLSPIMPRAKRRDFFWPVNYHGVEHILERLADAGCNRLVHFTTDMVYGHTQSVPTPETHPTKPLGEYGESKLATETLCADYRKQGMQISIFRPRLIIGPGRLGILVKLFWLIDHHLPVPMIGSGRNPYQFIAVQDCANAARLAWEKGVPNGVYNLGSKNPPSVRKLLSRLIGVAGSRSILLPVWAPAVKAALTTLDWMNMPLMDPEQYLIADEVCILDTTAAERDLGWHPADSDDDMLIAAYRTYRDKIGAPLAIKPTAYAA